MPLVVSVDSSSDDDDSVASEEHSRNVRSSSAIQRHSSDPAVSRNIARLQQQQQHAAKLQQPNRGSAIYANVNIPGRSGLDVVPTSRPLCECLAATRRQFLAAAMYWLGRWTSKLY